MVSRFYRVDPPWDHISKGGCYYFYVGCRFVRFALQCVVSVFRIIASSRVVSGFFHLFLVSVLVARGFGNTALTFWFLEVSDFNGCFRRVVFVFVRMFARRCCVVLFFSVLGEERVVVVCSD